MKRFQIFAFSGALLLAVAGVSAQVINPNPPAQAGVGLSQAGSTLNVIYGTTAATAKQGNAVDTVAQGGTGLSTVPAHSVMVGNGTGTLTTLTPGASGTVLTSNGTSVDPSYQVPPTALVSSVFGQTGAIPNLSGAVTTGGSSVTAFSPGGTNGQFLGSNGASAPTWQTPIISLQQTGLAGTQNEVLLGSTTPTGNPTWAPLPVTAMAPAGTAGQVLTSNGASAPTYQAPAVASVFTQTGTVPNLSGAVQTSGSSVTSFSPAGTAGQVLTSNGASAPTFQGIPTAAILPSVSKLSAAITASSATATFAAQAAVLINSSNAATLINNPSASINLATTGAGGMDTGAAPASGFVAVYYIFNGTTLSTLGQDVTAATSITESYSGANMPTGYTYSALVTVLPTNAGATFNEAYASGRNVASGFPVHSGSGTIGSTLLTLGVPAFSTSIILQAFANTAAYSGINLNASPLSSLTGSTGLSCAPLTVAYLCTNTFFIAYNNGVYVSASASSGTWSFEAISFNF